MPGAPSQYDQSHYQWRADDDAIGSETNLEAEDAPHDIPEDADTALRLHVQVADTLNGAEGTIPANKQLEFRHFDGVSFSAFANVTGVSSFIRAVASTHFDDGDACSDDLTDSSSNAAFLSLASDENNGITASVGYAGDRRHQGVWNLQTQSADLADGDQLELRIEAGGDITTYLVTPLLNIVAGGAADSPAGGAAEESSNTGRKLGRPKKPEGDNPAEQSATVTPNPKPPQFRGPTIINPPVTIRGLGPGISESLEEEELDAPTMPMPMPEPPLKFD